MSSPASASTAVRLDGELWAADGNAVLVADFVENQGRSPPAVALLAREPCC